MVPEYAQDSPRHYLQSHLKIAAVVYTLLEEVNEFKMLNTCITFLLHMFFAVLIEGLLDSTLSD